VTEPARNDPTRVPGGDGRWTGYQKWLVFLTALTIVFDGIDNQLLGVSIPTIMREWSVPRSAFAPVATLGYVGMMIGGASAGLAGDRVGRRTALIGSMLLFGVATLATAWADTPAAFGVLRLVVGAGLGGAIPNAAALAAEFVPKHRRPLAVTLTIVCVPVGATIAGLLGTHVLPAIGWRSMFAIGGVLPVALGLALLRLLPESPSFLARGPRRQSERTSLGALLTPELRRDTLALWGAFLSCMLSVYVGFGWLPALLAGAGFSPATASSGITAFNLGGVIGAIAGGVVMTRIGSRISMLAMTAGAITGAVVLSLMTVAVSEPVFPILAMLTLTGGLINAVQTVMYALAAHVYPSAVRATGVGTASSIGRLGAIISGYLGAWAIDYRGSASYFGLIAASMTVTFVSLALVRRHVAPRTTDQ
jgi:AAHS family 4-hydroxybenzoate transporter-like MFS transporter